MFVSVIIPVYNDPSGIGKVLGSLVDQSYPGDRYEIVVVDNNSTDHTTRVVQHFMTQYPGMIRLVHERSAQSAYVARNRGIMIAEGEVLAFTDSDCIPVSEWIEKGIAVFRDPAVSMVAGRVDMIFKEARPNLWEYSDAARKLDQKAYVEQVGFGATANLFVRRWVFDEYGPFLHTLASGGDYEFGRRVTRAGERLVYAENTLVRHPARSSLRAILKKSKRVAQGQGQLQDQGLLKHGVLSMRSLIPVRKAPKLESNAMSGMGRLAILFLYNLLRYYNFVIRLRHKSVGASEE